MLEFGRKVMRVGTEIEGSVSFELSEENADLVEKAAAHEQICVVVDQVWNGMVFGEACSADVRIAAKGLLEQVDSDQGNLFKIVGSYYYYIQAASN